MHEISLVTDHDSQRAQQTDFRIYEGMGKGSRVVDSRTLLELVKS